MLEIMVIRPRKREEGAELGVEHTMVVPVASPMPAPAVVQRRLIGAHIQ